MYVTIIRRTLLPFLHEVYSDGHRFMQDNDHNHIFRLAILFFSEKSINWWKIPPESPDLNSQNLWHEIQYVLPCSGVCCCRVFSHAMSVYGGTPDGIVVIMNIHVFM